MTIHRQDGNVTGLAMLRLARDDSQAASNNIGGQVVNCDAGQIDLKTGDIVYMGASSQVLKSTTAANYAGYIGVVVGGAWIATDTIMYGTGIPVNNAIGQQVYVQITGFALVTAGGTVTPGTHFTVVPDTVTAGRVIAGTTATTIVGGTVTAGASGAEMVILIKNR